MWVKKDGVYALPPQLSLPPTPFADHSPLETELQTREQMINHKNISGLHAPTSWGTNEDTIFDLEQDALLNDLLAMELSKAPPHGIPATPDVDQNHVMPGLDLNLDFEAFLATVTVPPPTQQAAPAVELTPEEIMSFIIPPPPVGNGDARSLSGDHVNSDTLNSSRKETSQSEQELSNNPHVRKNSSPAPSQTTDGTNARVIEYPTVNRKGGAFSCCGKYRDSPEKNTVPSSVIQPPPRNGQDSSKPPARPPKSEHHIAMRRGSNTEIPANPSGNSGEINGGAEIPPPVLPPRSDVTGHYQVPPNTWLPPKKPPLPPVPSQDVLKRSAQRSPVPVPKVISNVPKAGLTNSPPVRNGHIIPRSGGLGPSPPSREVVFAKSDATMVSLLERLDQVVAQCSKAQAAGGGACMDEARFQTAKEMLTNEARQLVTASKLLVKSVTDSTGHELAENLASCLHHLQRLTELASDATAHTTAPLQTRNLVLKVRDVAAVFRETLVSALGTADVPESLLLQRAENLASVLATLLRSLRVFSP